MTERPWPRLYQIKSAELKALTEAEYQVLYAEYAAFWSGRESHSNRTEQSDYQKDRDEDKRGDFR